MPSAPTGPSSSSGVSAPTGLSSGSVVSATSCWTAASTVSGIKDCNFANDSGLSNAAQSTVSRPPGLSARIASKTSGCSDASRSDICPLVPKNAGALRR